MKTIKYLLLNFLFLFFVNVSSAWEVSGTAINTETGAVLPGFEILVVYTTGGIAGSDVTSPDGTFAISGIPDGTYNLEFYSYPDPVILNGAYFMNTVHNETIIVNGGDVTDILFAIPPHYPHFTVAGTLYDASTNDPLSGQNLEVRLKMMYYVEFFISWSEDDGTYVIDSIPDWSYDFSIFENPCYNGIETEITIDPFGPDTLFMDFYLEPKSGVTVSGRLYDCETNEPIERAGRTVELDAINSIFTETDSSGKFEFVNIEPGFYSSLGTTSEDTAYLNCDLSVIQSFEVPDTGISGVSLYQDRFISVHEVTVDDETFEPGETKSLEFSLVHDDMTYGSVWGIGLKLPDGVNVIDRTPFFMYGSNEEIFEPHLECDDDNILNWEGFHFINPPFGPAVGNLENLNDSVYSMVELQFSDNVPMDSVGIFYQVFYSGLCYVQPFSYGNITMKNENIVSVDPSNKVLRNSLNSYPNPASDRVMISVTLDKPVHGKISVYDVTGQLIYQGTDRLYKKGKNKEPVFVSGYKPGIYFCKFTGGGLELTGKLIVSDQ